MEQPSPFYLSFFKKVQYTFELIKFSHTLFALPFALSAYLVAVRGNLNFVQLIWIVLAILFARTAAMAFNRLADAAFDAKNPRTQARHLPAGLLSQRFVLALIILSSIGFIFAALQLNTLALALSPFCLALLFFYSLTKRFTHFTQVFLGLSLGMAPIGAQVAATGTLQTSSLILGMAVLLWVAGFDLLYALQDLEFDRRHGLYSLPVKLGLTKTLQWSTALHVLFLFALGIYGKVEQLGPFYWGGLAVTGALLLWEHWILRRDPSRVSTAFFTANGLLSVVFFVFIAADVFLRS